MQTICFKTGIGYTAFLLLVAVLQTSFPVMGARKLNCVRYFLGHVKKWASYFFKVTELQLQLFREKVD